MFIDKSQFEAYLAEETPLYDRILGVYAVAGSHNKAAGLYEEFMKAGDFQNLEKIPYQDAFMIQTMWRVHLLHPRTYLEDCERYYTALVLPKYNTSGPLIPIGIKYEVAPSAHTNNMFCSMNLVDGMKRQLKFMSKVSNLEGFRNSL